MKEGGEARSSEGGGSRRRAKVQGWSWMEEMRRRKRNRRGRVRKEESQRQEEGGGRCDELVRMVESVRDIDGRGIEKDYQKLFDFRGRSDYF